MNLDDLRNLPSDAAMRFDHRPARTEVETALSDEVMAEACWSGGYADRKASAARSVVVQALVDAGLVKE